MMFLHHRRKPYLINLPLNCTPLRIVAICLGLVAFIMSSVSVAGCAFIVSPVSESVCYAKLGLFKYSPPIVCSNNISVWGGCTAYTKEMEKLMSSAMKASQAMGAIAACFAGITWVACIFMLFFKFPGWLFKTIGGVYCFCFVAQMLTLLALIECNEEETDAVSLYQCNLGKDAVTGIIAAIFYLGIGITVLVCPIPKTAVISFCGKCCKDGCDEGGCDCCNETSVEEVKSIPGERPLQGITDSVNDCKNVTNSAVTETYNADGTVTIKEERINADGSKTVLITKRQSASV